MPEKENKLQAAKSGRFVRFGLITSLILGVILIGIVFTNLDSLREPIIDELSRMTGLPIEMESLHLSLSNGLSLRGSRLRINSKGDSNQIFSAEELFLNAELKPLLKHQLKIKKIILVKPAMNIVLEPKLGSTVFPDTPETKKAPNQEIPLQSDEVEISDLPRTPKPDINFMGSIRNFLKHQNLSLRTVELQDATLTLIRPKGNGILTKKIPVLVDARFDLSNPNPDRFDIDGELSRLEAAGLNFTGTLKVMDFLGEHTPLKLALESASLPITKFNMLTTTLASLDVFPVKLESGEIEKLFIHMEGLINPNHNPLKDVVMKSRFKISDLEISIQESGKSASITFPHLNGEGIWQKDTLNYRVNGNLWNGSIESSLVFNLPQAMEGSFIGTLNSETKLKELNLSLAKFNFLDKWIPTTGTVNGFIKAQGTMNEPSSTVSTFAKLLISNLTLGSETPINFGHTTLNLQRRSPQQTLARIQIKDALFNNVPIKSVGVNLKILPKKISLTNGRLAPSSGVVLFSVDYHPQPNSYIIRINGKKIRIEDFLTEQMEGSGHFKGMFQGNLNAAQKIKQKGETVLFSHVARGLSGRLSIQLKDGGIGFSPIIGGLSTLLNSTSAFTTQKQSLNFNTLGGDLKIWKGTVITDNLELMGPQINLSALMAANLVTGKLDGEIKVMPMQLVESITKAIPLLGNLPGDITDIITETYFRLGGTLEKPKLIMGKGKTLFGKPASVLEKLVITSE